MKRFIKTIPNLHWGFRFLIFIGISIIGMLLTVIPAIIIALHKNNIVLSYVVLVVGVLIYMLIVSLLYRFWKNISIEYSKFKSEQKIIWSARNMFYFISSLLVYLSYHLLISHYLDHVDDKELPNITWFMILIVFLFQAVFAPIIEELITRGLFLSLFFREDKEWNIMLSTQLPVYPYMIRFIVAGIMSAFISSTLHGAVSDMAMYGLVINGLLCVWLYYKTKHIIIPIALHMFNNNIVVISMILFMLQQK